MNSDVHQILINAKSAKGLSEEDLLFLMTIGHKKTLESAIEAINAKVDTGEITNEEAQKSITILRDAKKKFDQIKDNFAVSAEETFRKYENKKELTLEEKKEKLKRLIQLEKELNITK